VKQYLLVGVALGTLSTPALAQQPNPQRAHCIGNIIARTTTQEQLYGGATQRMNWASAYCRQLYPDEVVATPQPAQSLPPRVLANNEDDCHGLCVPGSHKPLPTEPAEPAQPTLPAVVSPPQVQGKRPVFDAW
jgi:hypothetical protein